MKNNRKFRLVLIMAVPIIACIDHFAFGQGVIGADKPSNLIKWHETLAAAFKSRDTNAPSLLRPLMRMDWFSNPTQYENGEEQYCTIHWCYVERLGNARKGYSSMSNPSWEQQLNNSELKALVEAINKLPAPPKEVLPDEQKILISGIRSNVWFYAVYDRANIPKEVERVFEIARAPLEHLTNDQGKLVRPMR